jgi:hypothetical protein
MNRNRPESLISQEVEGEEEEDRTVDIRVISLLYSLLFLIISRI